MCLQTALCSENREKEKGKHEWKDFMERAWKIILMENAVSEENFRMKA